MEGKYIENVKRDMMKVKILFMLFLAFFGAEVFAAKNEIGISIVFDKRYSDVNAELKGMFINYGFNKVYKHSKEHFDLMTLDNIDLMRDIDGHKIHSKEMNFEWCQPNGRIDQLIARNKEKKIVLFIDNLKLAKFNHWVQSWGAQNVEVIGIDRNPSAKDYFFDQFKDYEKLSKNQPVHMIFWFPEESEVKWEITSGKNEEDLFTQGDLVELKLSVPVMYSDLKVSGTVNKKGNLEFEKRPEDGKTTYITEYIVKEGAQNLCVTVEGCRQQYCKTIGGEPCEEGNVKWDPNYKKKKERGPFTRDQTVEKRKKELGEYVLLERNLIYQFVINRQCAFDSYQLHYRPPFSKEDESNGLPDISDEWVVVDLKKSFDKVDEGYDLYKVDKDVFESTVFRYYTEDVILFYITPRGRKDLRSPEYRITLERCGGN
jgi:hypothetical protein